MSCGDFPLQASQALPTKISRPTITFNRDKLSISSIEFPQIYYRHFYAIRIRFFISQFLPIPPFQSPTAFEELEKLETIEQGNKNSTFYFCTQLSIGYLGIYSNVYLCIDFYRKFELFGIRRKFQHFENVRRNKISIPWQIYLIVAINDGFTPNRIFLLAARKPTRIYELFGETNNNVILYWHLLQWNGSPCCLCFCHPNNRGVWNLSNLHKMFALDYHIDFYPNTQRTRLTECI